MTDPAPDRARRRPSLSLRPGTLRGRLALLAALAVFAAVAAAGGAAFAVTSRVFVQQADADLVRGPGRVITQLELPGQALCSGLVPGGGPSGPAGGLPPGPGPTSTADPAPLPDRVLVEVLLPDGSPCSSSDDADRIVVTGADRAVAADTGPAPIRDGRSVAGHRLRVLSVPLKDGSVLIAARDLDDVVQAIGRLRGILLGFSVVGALLALMAGLAVARAGLRPIDDLADTAETIARTQDLSVRIDAPRARQDDEVARLADAFNRMTAALSAARDRQARLVADASHELRTPLTSLRTNIDLLVRSERAGRPLPAQQRGELLSDLTAQLDELSTLAGELTVLAHEEPARPLVPVRLDDVVRQAVERAARRADGHRFETVLAAWTVAGDRIALERAVVNLLDNAMKFSPAGSVVRIGLADGVLTVADQGPGIAEPDRPRATERFWRADAARSLPGSGLGLAIVADTVAQHQGRLQIDSAPGGGTLVSIALPRRPD